MLGALVWLQQHNFAYSNVVVWQDLLGLLPTDGIPPEMAAHVQYEDDAAAPADEAIGAPEPPPQGPEIAEALAEGSEAESAESDEAVVPDVDEGEEQRLAGEVEHAFVLQAPVANDDRQAVPQELAARFGAVAPAAPAAEAEAVPGPERGEPVSELETPGFWAGSYPWIFPHGDGDFLHPLRRLPLARVVGRPTGLELRIWVRHLLGHRSHRAAADPRFVGHVLNVANRMEARRRATAFVQFAGQVGEDPNLWTVEHVRQLPGDRHSDLASCITSFAHTIPGSRDFGQAERGSLEALIQQRRRDSGLIPAYFFTFGLNWRVNLHLHRLIRRGAGTVLSAAPLPAAEEPLAVELQRRLASALAQPQYVAWYWQRTAEAIITEVLQPALRGAAFWCRFEWASSREVLVGAVRPSGSQLRPYRPGAERKPRPPRKYNPIVRGAGGGLPASGVLFFLFRSPFSEHGVGHA